MVPLEAPTTQETLTKNLPTKSDAGAFKPEYTLYKPSGQTLVGQQVIPLYSWDRWTLTAYHDVHFVLEEWVLDTAVHNNTEDPVSEERTLELGSTVTQGSEKVDSVSASAGFSGWGFSMNIGGSSERRTFSSTEASQRQTFRREIKVSPGKSTYLYQKEFTFKLSIFFVWRDSQQFGGKELKYSSSSSWQDAIFLECVQTIKCDEWCYMDQKLQVGEGTITLPTPPRREPPPSVCQWHNMNGGSQQAIRAKYPGAAR